MKLFLSIFVCAAIFMAVEVKAENSWMRHYGEANRHEAGYSVQQTSDGGYIIAGVVNTGSVEYIYLLKTDVWGNTEWVTYGDNVESGNFEEPPIIYVKQTFEGGYIITNRRWGPQNNIDISLTKVDSVGFVSWTKSYDYGYRDCGNSVVQAPDSGYVIAGTAWNGVSGFQVRLIKVSFGGDSILWNKAYGDLFNNNSDGYCIEQATDGGYVIVGYVDNEVLLLKINPSGDSLWARTFGGAGVDKGYCIRRTSDGGYIITGFTGPASNNGDVYLIKTTGLGIVQWSKTYGGGALDCGYSVDQSLDGGYIITGITYSYGAGEKDVYLIKTDASGNLLWQKTYGDTMRDGGHSVQQASDGGYIVAGWAFQIPYTGYTDFYVIKTDSLGVADIWPPEVFSLLLPVDSAFILFSRPAFVWESTSDLRTGLKDYGVYIDNALRYNLADTSWTVNYDIPDGWHTWYVIASDSAGNERHSTETFAMLIDTTAPIIDSVTMWEDTSYYGPFPVLAKVTDNIGFDSIYFYYRIGGDTAAWQSSSMSDTGGGWFEDTIPPQSPVDSLQIDYYLKCSDWVGNTDSTAVHTFYIIVPGVEEDFELALTVFALSAPEPNPCIGNTVIRYQLPRKAEVSLKIYDMTGRLVTVLADEEKTAGYYTALWDGTADKGKKVRSGIYFYRMEAGSFKTTRKLTILR